MRAFFSKDRCERVARFTSAAGHRRHRCLLRLAGVLLALQVVIPAAMGVVDSMMVTDRSGTARVNYPLQFARPFVQGEIPDYPQVLVDGMPVATQADVKQRWPDGSVKHGIVSVLVPSIAANGSVALTFRNQSTGNNVPMTQEQMLGAGFDFDAVLRIGSDGQTRSVSARTMLADGRLCVLDGRSHCDDSHPGRP